MLNHILVTPRMHGVHHSIVQQETNSNMSVIFAWWDRAHGTLRLDVPQGIIVIGVPAYRDAAEFRFKALALLPFTRQRPDWSLPDGGHPDRPPQGHASWLAA